MPKPKDAQSFEVNGTAYKQHEDDLSLLKQASVDYVTPDMSRNFKLSMGGNRVTVYCMCYERGLGDFGRCQLQLQSMSKLMDEYLRSLKKRVRELGGGALKMKELKDLRGYEKDRVSLNDRWMINYHRTYEVDGLIQNPEA